MGTKKLFLIASGIVVGTTIGAGIFSLPYVFLKAGWAAGIVHLVVLTILVSYAHLLYYKVLERSGEGHGLLGLVRMHLGEMAGRVAFLAVVVGLVLTLSAYLVLSAQFVVTIIPHFGFWGGVIIFWLLGSIPLVVGLRPFVGAEVVGAVLMVAIILLAVVLAPSVERAVPALKVQDMFLPFGAVLFALAGWTAVEPVFRWRRKFPSARFSPVSAMGVGTGVSALLYALFAFGILSSANVVTTDTVSGLTNWGGGQHILLALFGLFAVWTSYLPIGLEVKSALEKDLSWKPWAAVAATVFVPLLLVVAGLRDFLSLVGVAGGVFLSFQYLFILAVARKALALSKTATLLVTFIMTVFLAAAVYEVYMFVVR